MMDYPEIEKKWQHVWSESKAFEHDPNERKSLLVTAAWPYVNMPPHIGHLRTYGTADFYSKYMRMRGYNVIFPMGWHYTGTPILAIVKRLQNKDQSLIKELKEFGVSDDDIAKMTDPLEVANFFTKQFKEAFQKAGMGIDWRREFVSIDPLYSKMVEWQFHKLMDEGFLVQGKHPVGWCSNEQNAVGQHDTKSDVQPEIEKMYLVKFAVKGEESYIGCATYRPETLYGVTNLFIKKESEYALVKIGDEKYYVAKEAIENMSGQYSIVTERAVEPSELLQKTAINPIDNKEIPVIDGYFVKPDFGTGIVMAVPAHAPFDYVALSRLKQGDAQKAPKEEYTQVIAVGAEKENTEIPSLAYLKKEAKDIAKVSDSEIEVATKKLYRDEQRHGMMLIGAYSGMPVQNAREAIASDMEKGGKLSYLYIIANEKPVYCRCGQRVIVKLLDKQWFIDYGNKQWKAKLHEYMPNVNVYPEKFKGALNASIDWIDLRAAERSQGLGTRFPFAPDHIIESLSDSTIYMAFYTIVHILKRMGARPEQLTGEFFEYVYRGAGKPEQVAEHTKLDIEAIKKCRESFSYWYKFTSRHSASELIPSHITMYLFNHVAMFDSDNWPKQVVLNGMVNYEGQKMSKSLGNVIPLLKAIKDYGADPVRFIQVLTADLSNDVDFSPGAVDSVNAKISFLNDIAEGLDTMSSGPLTHMDYWLYSKLNSKIEKVTKAMEILSVRSAYVEAFYESVNELKWYIDRGAQNQLVVSEYLQKVLLMLVPAIPYTSEELWHKLGNNSLAVNEKWPECDNSMISEKEEAIEDSIKATIDDVTRAISLTKPKDSENGPKSVRIILASDWKCKAYNALCKERTMEKALSNKEFASVEKQELAKFLSKYMKGLNSIKPMPEISQKEMNTAFTEAKKFMELKIRCNIDIESESESDSKRASRAETLKPSIDVVWA
jgi:leucyl-tRNA synthetase